MIRGIHRSRLLLGLAVVGAILVGESEARAAGIKVTMGKTQPIDDPVYEYQFDIELQAGTALDSGGYITIYDLAGVYSGSTTSQPGTPADPGLNWGSTVQLLGKSPTVGPSITDDPTLYNVTWQWNGSTIPASATDKSLGVFTILTDLNSTPTPTPTLVNYVGSADGTTVSNSGTITVTTVPEPASVILLVIGAGALPLYASRKRRHHPARSA